MENDYRINLSTYDWSVRLFHRVKRLLGVNIRLHQEENSAEQGDIFLFNHFARFETFIPQYLIYQQTGAICRSIASAEFFKPDDAFTNYLIKLGGVPNDQSDLLPFMAREILRGRKVVLFPEGGMVKDRSVMDDQGEFNIYSRTADLRRKHHSGAALLAMALEGFKTRIRRADRRGNKQQLEAWRKMLDLETLEDLLTAARKPTAIIPANITFYPIHTNDNFLRRSVEIFNRKKLSLRATEELLIESNLVMKNTDMDVRLGEPISPRQVWHWWDRYLLKLMNKRSIAIEDYFSLAPIKKNRLLQRIVEQVSHSTVGQLRDHYMESMYSLTTININHLTSLLIFELIKNGSLAIQLSTFYRCLYLCIKRTQQQTHIFLHRGLRRPEVYEGLFNGQASGIQNFLDSAVSSQLIELQGEQLVFTQKLRDEPEFDQIRLENIIVVYANEATPIQGLCELISTALNEQAQINEQQWASYRFDDELVRYAWDKSYYDKPRFDQINQQQEITHSGEPYFRLPEDKKPLGVVLTHGLPASPAELKAFAQRLEEKGFPVIGVRLAGHGTSPWDLNERSWPEWLDSVKRSYAIMAEHCDKVALLGFSTGSIVSLLAAADHPDKLAGVVSVAAPVKFNNKNIVFVPILYSVNKILSLLKSSDNNNPFRPNDSDHPEINYLHLPLKSLYQLRLMIDQMLKRLNDITCPVLIMHAQGDPVIEVESAYIIEKNIASTECSMVIVKSDRHGLILENIDDSQAHILAFLTRLAETEQDSPTTVQINE